MSLLAQFIRTYTILFLVSYLTIFTNEVHAPAAPAFFDYDEITTVKPLEANTVTGDFNGQEHHPGLEQTVIRSDDFNGQEHHSDLEQTAIRSGDFNGQELHPGLEQTVIRSDDFEGKKETTTSTTNTSRVDFEGRKETTTTKTFTSRDDFGKKETTTTKTYTSRANGCSFPPRLDFAQPKDSVLDQTTFPKDSIVYYNCRPGYKRVPGAINYRRCLKDGTWSIPGTFCQRRSCGNPGEVENAEMTADDFLFGSTVTFVCNPGYRMATRRNYRECQADGTWSYTLPECEVQLCPPPPEIIDGEMYPLKEEYAYLDSVTYSCNRNMALIGESSVSCKEDGQWSSNAPVCKRVNCINPYVPNSRKISGTSGPYNFNSAVRFMCLSDHVLNGSDTIKCNQNSEWEPALPKCIAVCRYVPSIHYAEPVEPTREKKFLEGETLQFKCKEGYDPVPNANNVLTCLGRTWSLHKTFCRPISCGDPDSIRNGYIAGGSYLFGSAVTYACDIGYTLIGDSSRRCQADGNWSLPIPKCEVKTCPYPNITQNTFFIPEKTQYQYGDKLSYSCGEGYKLTGESESVCNYEGRWSPNLPSCRGICLEPPELEYAQLDQTFLPGETIFQNKEVTYTCRKGYSRDYQHKNTLKCLGNFEWSHTEIFCSRISCGPPEAIKNAVYEAKDFLFGSEAVYKCKKGYNMVSGNNTRKCLDTKMWSYPVPKCEVQTCPPPEDLVNGSYSIQKRRYTYQDSVTYKCDKLTLVGEASVSCTAEGNWTSGAPECKAVCKSPPELRYGELEKTFPQNHFNVGTSLKYKCRPGYIFIDNANNEITCGPDLKWSEPEVFCERLSCDNPGDIPHGQMKFKDFLFESKVNYTCEPGYTMISRRNYRKCQADGTWSGTPPVCKASICDNIWELQEEARKCTSTPDEWIKYLQVQYLYLQIENIKLDIEIKKKKLSTEKKQENFARK